MLNKTSFAQAQNSKNIKEERMMKCKKTNIKIIKPNQSK